MSLSTTFPNITPSLNLNFLGNNRLDPRITFTRASTTATYVDYDGNIKTATNNEPRFDHDPVTLAPLGFLIEESRINLCIYSQDFTQTTWSASNSTKTTGISDPTGGVTAATITATSVNGSVQNAAATVVSGTTYTVSIWLRRRTGTGAVGIRAVENINTPVTITSTWARYSLTVTATQTVGRVGVYCSTIGDEVDFWGGQLEAGAFATSYIPTTNAAVTRAADVATINTLSPWFNPAEGTLYAKYTTFSVSQINGTVALSDGTNNNRMIIRATNASSQTVFIGVNDTTTVWGGILDSALANIVTNSVFAYKLNDIAWVRNGGTVGTDSSANIPVVNQLRLGVDGGGTFPLNGYLHRVTYYPRRLTDSELQALTK
jgi:hypothetical protein